MILRGIVAFGLNGAHPVNIDNNDFSAGPAFGAVINCFQNGEHVDQFLLELHLNIENLTAYCFQLGKWIRKIIQKAACQRSGIQFGCLLI